MVSTDLKSNAKILVVEDNAAIHNARRTIAARASLGINRLDHPPSSPDLNPIEGMWHEVKRRLALLPRASTLDMLKAQIVAIWDAIPLTFVNHLILSMEDRRVAVLRAKGFQTRY